jgi:hypothetical protein
LFCGGFFYLNINKKKLLINEKKKLKYLRFIFFGKSEKKK